MNFENVRRRTARHGSARDESALTRGPLPGLIAEYCATEPYRYKSLRAILVKRIKMRGMIVFDWKDRYGEALQQLAALFRSR